jgi:hypothetical protein
MKNAQADTQKLEREIGRLVYAIYNLDDDEIVTIEGRQT